MKRDLQNTRLTLTTRCQLLIWRLAHHKINYIEAKKNDCQRRQDYKKKS